MNHRGNGAKKKGLQIADINMHVDENKSDVKLTNVKFTPNLECY